MLVGYKWYKKEQARQFAPILSCYALRLRDISGKMYSGYYYCGKFYHEQTDVTEQVEEWMIPQYGEKINN